jgi:hypothetical protein
MHPAPQEVAGRTGRESCSGVLILPDTIVEWPLVGQMNPLLSPLSCVSRTPVGLSLGTRPTPTTPIDIGGVFPMRQVGGGKTFSKSFMAQLVVSGGIQTSTALASAPDTIWGIGIVLWGQFMAPVAMGLTHIWGGSTHVLFVGYGFQMSRVDTYPITAEMIDFQSQGDRANDIFIDSHVGIDYLPVPEAETPIARGSTAGRNPGPTFIYPPTINF